MRYAKGGCVVVVAADAAVAGAVSAAGVEGSDRGPVLERFSEMSDHRFPSYLRGVFEGEGPASRASMTGLCPALTLPCCCCALLGDPGDDVDVEEAPVAPPPPPLSLELGSV